MIPSFVQKYFSYIIIVLGIVSTLSTFLLVDVSVFDIHIDLFEEVAGPNILFLFLYGAGLVSAYIHRTFMKGGLISRIVTFCYFHFSFFVVLPISIFLVTPRGSCGGIMCDISLGTLSAIFLFLIGIFVVLVDILGVLVQRQSVITRDFKKRMLAHVKDGLGWLSILISLLILLLIVINLAVVGIMYNTVLVQGSDSEIVRNYALYENDYSDIFFSSDGVLSIRGIASPERENHTLITETAIQYENPDICSASYAENDCVEQVNNSILWE